VAVSVFTGAGNGIGRAAALAFAREGATVVVADISERGNEETVRMIQELGGRARAVRCDVAQASDIEWVSAHAPGSQQKGKMREYHPVPGELASGF
jgi:NAD(P)-dependent dehydrogenase (short-subunit alcohol dehydrogenase family)